LVGVLCLEAPLPACSQQALPAWWFDLLHNHGQTSK
jgi:hypothetical protein